MTDTPHPTCRTLTPPARRTIWTITICRASYDDATVLDGALTRSAAIRQALRGNPLYAGETLVATHSVLCAATVAAMAAADAEDAADTVAPRHPSWNAPTWSAR